MHDDRRFDDDFMPIPEVERDDRLAAGTPTPGWPGRYMSDATDGDSTAGVRLASAPGTTVLEPGGVRGSRPALIFLAVGAVVVMMLVVSFVVLFSSSARSASDASTIPTAEESAPARPAESAPPFETPTETPEPSVAGIDGGPGMVAGNNFSVADHPYKIGPTRLPFAFAFPAGWDCMYSSESTVQTTGGYTCFQSAFATRESRVGGRIGYQRCAEACTQAEIDEVGKKMYIEPDDWRDVDPTTTFAERSGKADGQDKVRVGMRQVYAPSGGEPNTIAFAVLTGDPEYRDTMLKVLNSVRANAT